MLDCVLNTLLTLFNQTKNANLLNQTSHLFAPKMNWLVYLRELTLKIDDVHDEHIFERGAKSNTRFFINNAFLSSALVLLN